MTSNACGNNVQTTSTLFYTTNAPPNHPADITAHNGLCFPASSTAGSTDILFEASIVSGAQNYIWEWDSPVVLGTQQDGTGQFLTNIILSVPNSATSFKVRVKTQNGCGYSAIKEVTFTTNRLPAVIITNQTVC